MILTSIPTLETNEIKGKRVLLRVDCNVPIDNNGNITDDTRIKQILPTITLLLQQHNKIIVISHLGRPSDREKKLSLASVAAKLQHYLESYTVALIDNFRLDSAKVQLAAQEEKQIVVLENIRFFKEEKANDPLFAKALASLGDAYVNDAFSVCHRKDASIIGIPLHLPSYAGLLLEKEINGISSVMQHPKKPFVAIIGGAKISTKLAFLSKLTNIADFLLLGGGLANTVLLSQGVSVGESLSEKTQIEQAKQLLADAKQKNTTLVLPTDFVCMEANEKKTISVYSTNEIPANTSIYDIGPQTQANYSAIIAKANTLVWNGPVGFFEDNAFAKGTDALYNAIIANNHVKSLVGGGDTLAAISKKPNLDKITHISTGGGAMLEFIENGTLPGLEALK